MDEGTFARASHIGTWVKQGYPPRSIRVKPLVIEWEPGSTVVGDFTWVGTYSYMTKRTIAEQLLAAGFKGFEVGPVEMVPNPEYKRYRHNMIQLPYDGAELVDLFVARKDVPFNRERSTVRIVSEEHGKPVYELEGDERIEHGDWHPETGKLDRIHVPRTPGMGVYIDARELGDIDVFVVGELRMGPFCTDRFRDFVLEKGYTNITFFEVGETIECSF